MGGRYLLERDWTAPGASLGRAQEFPGDVSPGNVSVALQTSTASLNVEAIRIAPPKSKKQKVPWLFLVFNERKSVLFLSVSKARWPVWRTR